MSKQRAQARAERLAIAESRAAEVARRREQEAVARARRERRQRWWRSVRLWQHGPVVRSRVTRERAGVLGCVVLGLLLVTYLVSRSAEITLVTALVCVVASPLLFTLFFDRSRK